VEGPTEQDVEDAKNGVDESKLEETDAGVAPADAAGAPPADAAGAAPADADEEPVTNAETEWGRWKQRSKGKKLDTEPPWLYSVSFSPCATFLACVSKMGVLTVMKKKEKGSWTGDVDLLYDRRESEENAQRTKIVSSAACRFSPLLEGPDGPFVLLAVALMNHRVIVRDALTGYLRYVLDCKGTGNSVDFSRERSLLAVATSRGVRIFDASTGARAHYFKDERTECLCFSPSGFAIVYGTAAPPSHIAIRSLRIDTVERVIMNVDGTEIGKRNVLKQRRNSAWQLPHVDDGRPDLTPQSSQSTLPHAETPPPAPKLTLLSKLTTPSARALRSTRSADHVVRREVTGRQRFQKIGGNVIAQTRATQRFLAPQESFSEDGFLSEKPFTHAAVARSARGIVVAAITDQGRLMACELGHEASGKILRRAQVDENTNVISPKCVALSADAKCVAYAVDEVTGGALKLTVREVKTHSGKTASFSKLRLTEFDSKDAKNTKNGDVEFARVAFSCSGNLLACYNQNRDLAV
jgi:hypothetical protein